jgi:hypothetical protein
LRFSLGGKGRHSMSFTKTTATLSVGLLSVGEMKRVFMLIIRCKSRDAGGVMLKRCSLSVLLSAIPLLSSYPDDNIGRAIPQANFKLAQCGHWSNCWGYANPNLIIVAQNTGDGQSCHTAIQKCNNNVEINTTYSNQAQLQPCNITIILCNNAN